MAVQVWLGDRGPTPGAVVVPPEGTTLRSDGRLPLPLPSARDRWEIDVVLLAPGFEFDDVAGNLRRIVLPQVMPGVLSGSLIVFGLSASAFAIPGLLGGRRLKMVATVVYDEYLHELNWPLGAAIALTLRARKDSRYQDPAEQVRVRKADRVRIVQMAPVVDAPSTPAADQEGSKS